jgi:hypothetical protein
MPQVFSNAEATPACAACGCECALDFQLLPSAGDYVARSCIAPGQDRVRSRWFSAADDLDFCSALCSLAYAEWRRTGAVPAWVTAARG